MSTERAGDGRAGAAHASCQAMGGGGSRGATLTALRPTCLTHKLEPPPLKCQDPPPACSPSHPGSCLFHAGQAAADHI